MKGSEFDEALFFRALSASGLRAPLIGRRALIGSKHIGSRPKDAEDVRLLQQLRKQREAL